MATNGNSFIAPSSLAAAPVTSNQYLNLPTAGIDNPLLSIKTSAGSVGSIDRALQDGASITGDKFQYKTVEKALPTSAQTKQQIIIHEFLNNHSGSFVNRHNHHHPHVTTQNRLEPEGNASNSSITILTSHQNNFPTNPAIVGPKASGMVLDRINICINNHFTEPQHLGGGGVPAMQQFAASSDKRSSTDLEPDSTTSSLGQLPVTPEKNGGKFRLQEDVLVEHKDGRLYLGTVIAVGNSQCLVRFNDNTECWSDFRELTKLAGGETDDSPACVVCKRQSIDDTVEVCENCGRGYHVKCMDGNFERNGYWFCRMCASPNGKKKDIRYVCSGVLSESLDPLTNKSQLSYDIDSLTWNGQHSINLEQHYCYCGDDGDWLREMIQCCRCQQWFHGRCIRSLQYPIFLGDRFYFFICSICNLGHEFVRRLEVSWPDLIHLALYNLIARNGKRFYDVTKAIAPYVEDNWKTLQMSEQMTKLSPNARKEIITQTLTNDRIRFKCGSESGKPSTLWTLRVAQPPVPPNVLIPAGQIITEHMLTQMSRENRIYRFLPRVALEKSFVNDALSREKMTGVSYCSPLVSEDDASDMSEDTNQDENSSDYEAAAGAGTGELSKTSRDAATVDVVVGVSAGEGGDPARLNQDAIFVSTGKNASSNLSDSLFNSNAKDGFQLFGTGGSCSKPQSETGSVASGSGNRRVFNKSRSKKTDSEKSFDIYDSSDDTSRNTLDLIIPPPKDFTGKNNPFHQPTAILGASAVPSSGAANQPKSNETKDLMQKASTSNVSHISSNLVNGELRVARIVKRRLSARDIMSGSKNKRRKFRKSSVIGTTITAIPAPVPVAPVPGQSSSLIASLFSQPVDSSGWCSQITLNHLLPSTSSSGSSTPASCSYPANNSPQNNIVPQTLPLAALNATTTSSSSSSPAMATLPKRSPAHGRRLRQRQERNYAEPSSRRTSAPTANSTPVNSLPNTPTKNGSPPSGAVSPSSNGADLQSSLNLYFGAAHRILSGEKFFIKGKRITPSGKVQYLIEWEGCPAQIM